MEEMAKIIQSLLAVAHPADRGFHIKPDQEAFRIEVHTAPPAFEFRSSAIENLGSIGGVLKWPPTAPRSVIQRSRGFRRFVQELLFGPQAAAGSEDLAQILCEPFIDP